MPEPVMAEIMSNKRLASLTKKCIISRDGGKPMFSSKAVSRSSNATPVLERVRGEISTPRTEFMLRLQIVGKNWEN